MSTGMKIGWLKGILGIIPYFFSCQPANTTEKQAALLHVRNDSINLGKLRLKDSMLIVFDVSNEGNEDLLIISAGSSCGCSRVYFKDSVLAPGSRSEIRVNFFRVIAAGKVCP